jgi:hypothetical protein
VNPVLTRTGVDKDVLNVEAWAEVIEDLLFLVPADKRAEVLALASKNRQIF